MSRNLHVVIMQLQLLKALLRANLTKLFGVEALKH